MGEVNSINNTVKEFAKESADILNSLRVKNYSMMEMSAILDAAKSMIITQQTAEFIQKTLLECKGNG